ncbi:MAG: hypothetical protein QOG42_1785 [Solirubrobacteraceae bacterium]|nr:hypothetical protein [Solirubrobacteraceae bacterium]
MSEHPVIACYRGLDSADAVGLGALLARALGEPLILASAYRYEAAGLSARPLPRPDNERRAQAAAAVLRRARQFAGPGIDVREEIVPSARIADALVGLGRDVDACVLVLGRDTQGRVTRSIIPQAPCPVLVAPLSVPLPRPAALQRIGVAYDASPAARCALVAAAHLARTTGAQLELLVVARSSEHAAATLKTADPAAHEYTTTALVGDPRGQLAQESARLDLLVCGSRGRGRPLATILGSVSTHLVTHARCPVLVVPPTVTRSPGRPLGITSAAASA